MVRRERKKSTVIFVPECTCNKKVNRVTWRDSKILPNPDAQSYAEDHEELHTISRLIVDFIAETGKMQKEDILENFPDYKEGQLSMAANMSMYPIIFPKRRAGTAQQIHQLKQHAFQLTQQYRWAKYASDNDEDENTKETDR